MGSRFAPIILLFAGLTPASASGMSPVSQATPGRCHVVGGEKLPPAIGGGNAICVEIGRAVATVAPAARYSAEVRVVSSSRLAAVLKVDGRLLPEQNFAIMDSELNAGAIQRFARSLAAEIKKAAKS